jgi:hypothetical protein
MHGTIQTTTKTAFDRRAVMARASKLWALAKDVAARGPYDGLAIERAALAAGASHQGAIEARNADYADRREVKGISTWGDAMRAAWAVERRVDAERREQAEREIASALARPIAGYAAERLAAECLPWGMEAERLRRLADIARREAANI